MPSILSAELEPAQYYELLSGQLLPENSRLCSSLVFPGPDTEANVKAGKFLTLRAATPALGSVISLQIKGESKAPNFSPPERVRYSKNSYHGGDITFLPAEYPVIGKTSCTLTLECQSLEGEWQLDWKELEITTAQKLDVDVDSANALLASGELLIDFRESFHLHTEQSEQFIIHTLPQPGFNQPARVVHHDDQVAGPSALQTDTLSGSLVQHPPSHSPLLHLEPLPEAAISSAIWEHQDQGMINYFVQAFGPEPAQDAVEGWINQDMDMTEDIPNEPDSSRLQVSAGQTPTPDSTPAHFPYLSVGDALLNTSPKVLTVKGSATVCGDVTATSLNQTSDQRANPRHEDETDCWEWVRDPSEECESNWAEPNIHPEIWGQTAAAESPERRTPQSGQASFQMPPQAPKLPSLIKRVSKLLATVDPKSSSHPQRSIRRAVTIVDPHSKQPVVLPKVTCPAWQPNTATAIRPVQHGSAGPADTRRTKTVLAIIDPVTSATVQPTEHTCAAALVSIPEAQELLDSELANCIASNTAVSDASAHGATIFSDISGQEVTAC
ncbi:hypothetical protein WJX82_007167 [Trebouxia sp. C0006]